MVVIGNIVVKYALSNTIERAYMGRPSLIAVGMIFARWTVLSRETEPGGNPVKWKVRCVCGTEKVISGKTLLNGHSKSCGCYGKEVHLVHGHGSRHKRSPLYTCWFNLIQRCTNPKNKQFPGYGGRGITVCIRWRIFTCFLEDMGPTWKEGLTIDRRNNDLGYSPENCHWITKQKNCSNTRNSVVIEYQGRQMVLAEWARELGINVGTLARRYRNGWSPERMFNQSIESRPKIFLEYDGRRMTISDWARELGVKINTLNCRYNAGWPIERMLQPVKKE